MQTFTIEDFWKARLKLDRLTSDRMTKGWEFENAGLATFREAPLTLSSELSADADVNAAPILLVSAPGAVGKSTLAKQIAFETGGVFVDLAKADPVGGNTLSGGLVKSGLFAAWESQRTALLIDSLDEARLRVTQESFEAFLADVVDLSKDRNVPIVLFGRTGAIQEAWLVLEVSGAKTAVLEIGYYDKNDAVEFVDAILRSKRPDSPHAATERAAIKILLDRLGDQAGGDGKRFAGYAPVLQVVADRVAGEPNASALIAQIEQGGEPITLYRVAETILSRERQKLETLQLEDSELRGLLYSHDEQLDRLVARVYGSAPPDLPAMDAKDAQTYDRALQTWVPEHPFLDGRDKPSSAVFEAVITASALQFGPVAEAAERELAKGAAANPFLAEFYPKERDDSAYLLPPDHIGIVYASIRAGLSLGDHASLLVNADEDEDADLNAEVEITLARRDDGTAKVLRFKSPANGPIRLGFHLEDIEIDAPHSSIEIGSGSEAILVAPISITCNELNISATSLVVERPSSVELGDVALEAQHYTGASMTSVPTLRGGVSLSVSWPTAKSHPWTSFATTPSVVNDPRIEEGLRRFRRFAISFRSHSKGALARFQDKIDHYRMTKDTGQAILDALIKEGVIELKGPMYFLDPEALAEKTGTTYADAIARRFSSKTLDFIRRAIG